MPRTGDEYSLPAGTAAVSSTVANSSHVNSRFSDLEAEQNLARPISAGGTGATSASAARTNLGLAIGTNVQGYDAGLQQIADLADPNADRILFWDDSAGAYTYLTVGANLSISGTTLTATDQTPADGSITFAKLAAAAVTTSGEAIAFNDSDTQIPTSAAVIDYVAVYGGWNFLPKQTTTSGTAFDFPDIPSWANEIVVFMRDVSLSGTDAILVQIGDSGGIETTGYTNTVQLSESGAISTSVGNTEGFTISAANAANTITTTVRMYRPDPATPEWIADAVIRRGAQFALMSGYKTLSDTLDRVRVTRSGTNTFDLGYVGLGYRA